MLVPNRHGSSRFYRYGFNGKEKDDEVKGDGNSINYGFRIYDPRIGRFLSYDPLAAQFPYWSPYHFAGNSPIENVDLDGLEVYNYRLLFDNNGKSYLKFVNRKDGSWCNALTVQKVHYNGGTYTIHSEWNYAPHDGFEKVKKLNGLGMIQTLNFFSNLKTDSEKEIEAKEKKDRDEQEFFEGYYMASGIKPGTYTNTGTSSSKPSSSSKKSSVSSVENVNKALVSTSGKAGGGAKLENIAVATRDRIQAISNKYELKITVVGSRAGGTATVNSDWDYIIEGGTSKSRSSALYQLPKNLNANKGGDMRPGSEQLTGVKVDDCEPHITFVPQNK